jgi:hypothetical protein
MLQFQIAAMNSGSGAGAEETPRSVGPEGSSAASAIAGEFPLSDKAGLCRRAASLGPSIESAPFSRCQPVYACASSTDKLFGYPLCACSWVLPACVLPIPNSLNSASLELC